MADSSSLPQPPPHDRQALIRCLCQLQAEVAQSRLGYAGANDCFCGEEGFWKHGGTEDDFRSDGEAVAFIVAATRAALRAPSSPPPPATPSEKAIEAGIRAACALIGRINPHPSAPLVAQVKAALRAAYAVDFGAQSRSEAKHPAPPAEEAR